jgi:DNA-binding transcriptional regulator YiaG
MKDYQNPEVLKKLYWKERLSQREIARKFGVSQRTINHWMKKFNIPRRYFNRPDITKEVLEELYLKKKLSMPKIAKMLHTTYDTIWKKMRKYGIKVRTMSEAKMKYPKKPFSGDLTEKAYMLGLRAGDISADRAGKQITVVTATTHQAQLEMFRNVFEKYSFVNSFITTMKDGRKAWRIYCRLDNSFEFLLYKPNEIPKWILDDKNYFYAFLAGYADCEACWNIWKLKDCKKARTRFQITSGDKIILEQITNKLKEYHFKPRLRLAHKKGYRKTYGKYNKDMYCLNLHYQKEIRRLVKILLKFSKHAEKIWKMRFILEKQNKNWEDVKYKINEFKQQIKETNLNKSPKLQPQFRPHANSFSA